MAENGTIAQRSIRWTSRKFKLKLLKLCAVDFGSARVATQGGSSAVIGSVVPFGERDAALLLVAQVTLSQYRVIGTQLPVL